MSINCGKYFEDFGLARESVKESKGVMGGKERLLGILQAATQKKDMLLAAVQTVQNSQANTSSKGSELFCLESLRSRRAQGKIADLQDGAHQAQCEVDALLDACAQIESMDSSGIGC